MAPRYNQIKYYSGGSAPRTLSGPNVKIPKFVEPKIPPGVGAQAVQGLSKVAAAFFKADKDKKDKAAKRADEDAATRMIEALTTRFDPTKYGASPQTLMAAAEEMPEGEEDDAWAAPSPEEQREFYTDQANKTQSDYGSTYGAGLVRANQARGDYNTQDNRDWLAKLRDVDEPKGMGPESRSTMRKILLGDMAKTDAAELLAGERRYKRTVAENLAENKLAAARAKRGNVKYGNTPIWGTDKGGRPIVMQPSSAGGPLRVADLPEGVTAQRGGTRTVDLGDRYAVLDANGGLIGYRAKGIDPEKTPKHAGLVEGTKKAAALSMKIAGEAWESLGKVDKNIRNVDDAIAAIDAGANTGPIYKMLPSISAASVELDNIQNRMGLDVIGTVTFGALSKGELDLALSTALPTGLKPPELRKWLLGKRSAQAKLSKYLTSAAIYLGKPGNTVSKWAEMQKSKGAANVDDKVNRALKKYGG